ncbi:jg6645 [Pararge aegeria aegeria]|uniref:Jg6645 protein n=1 Tax=Pararge aegeria aegeria TaxID=348720 RepID=A0A8S4RSA9_9NEOP|nr:jg6645 [Pararge aegeria aegeria]
MDLLNEEDSKKNDPTRRLFFLRQLFVSSTLTSGFLIYGMYMGAMTVMIPQIRREANSTEAITADQASWLCSLPGYSGLPWGIVLPFIAYRFGRKISLIMLSVSILISNIIFYRSTTLTELMISQAMTGMLECSTNTLTIMVITEYTSPRYRGVFMTLKSASFYWGIWISNAMGTFFHWTNIGLVIFVFSVYNLLVIFYPESPFWLATKGRYEDCSKCHRWLKGTSKDSEEELEKLILSQKQQNTKIKKQHSENIIVMFYRIVSCVTFYKPIFYAVLGTGLYHSSGKMAYSVYAIDIIQKITGSENTAYEGMLILDGVTILGMYLGSPLTKVLKRRTQLLSFSSIGAGFLFIMSIYLYMIQFNLLLENKYISLFLLVGFSISIGCGPMVMAACCYGELTPLKYRSTYLSIFTLLSSAATGSDLKTAPLVFRKFGTPGAFLYYAITSTVFICLLYKYLPETKDKTIQEIENCVVGEDDINEVETMPLKHK